MLLPKYPSQKITKMNTKTPPTCKGSAVICEKHCIVKPVVLEFIAEPNICISFQFP